MSRRHTELVGGPYHGQIERNLVVCVLPGGADIVTVTGRHGTHRYVATGQTTPRGHCEAVHSPMDPRAEAVEREAVAT